MVVVPDEPDVPLLFPLFWLVKAVEVEDAVAAAAAAAEVQNS